MRWLSNAADWFDSRTGIRAMRAHLLDEPVKAGVGWWFVTGSVLLLLLSVQLLTGVILAMYYVPTPQFAYDSIRYIMQRLTFGSVLRGLHFFGASLIVIAAVVHMLRVVMWGSYKKPREVTWITGVVLLLVILGFALSGYLLPWDQKAYWATTVTINIARNMPMGDSIAALMKGGSTMGSLTLLRWYVVHVFVLPGTLITFVIAHLYLMRRHGISGAIVPVEGPSRPFYPYHAIKDTVAASLVFALLLTLAIAFTPPLDSIADPTDASYVPRPEWYFFSLFQLLKYFPGPLEPVATMLIPGLVVGLLVFLPFLDRRPDRHPLKRPVVTGAFVVLGAGILVLSYLGYKDTPDHRDPSVWTPMAIAGRELVKGSACTDCHRLGGVADPIARLTKDPQWLLTHVRDPQVIAPGLRPPPPGGLTAPQTQAVLSYMRNLRTGSAEPQATPEVQMAALVFVRFCAACHAIDREGAAAAPDLSAIGRTRDASWLMQWISNPESIDPASQMPAFGTRLTREELTAISAYLAARK